MNLTQRESDYLRIMQAQYLVLYVKGRPGNAKTAILKSIADKEGYTLIDLRLATMDETELGVYPIPKTSAAGDYKVISAAVPEWAEKTLDQSKKYLVVFEELNRAALAVRNAALGLLLERRIGPNFTFGPNVLMAATGNLGVEDGTEVEELDTALKNRLITVEHRIDIDEWVRDYANENVHQDIVRYLTEKPSHYYPEMKEQEKNGGGLVVVTPRTWDGFSKFIINHYGKNSTWKDYGKEIERIGQYYIGVLNASFCKWVSDNTRLTLSDVLGGKVKDYSKFNRENLNEVLSDLKVHKIMNITLKEFTHVKKYLMSLEDDIRYGALWDLTTEIPFEDKDTKIPVVTEFIKEFGKEIKATRDRKAVTNEAAN